MSRYWITSGARRPATSCCSFWSAGENRRLNPTISSGAFPRTGMRRDDAIEIGPGDRQRFLDEDVLAGAERPHHLIGVIVVPGGNDDELEFGIVEDRVQIAREHFDLLIAREIAALRSGPADHAA